MKLLCFCVVLALTILRPSSAKAQDPEASTVGVVESMALEKDPGEDKRNWTKIGGGIALVSASVDLFLAGLFMAVFAKPTIVCVKAPCDNPPITEMVVGSTLFFAGSVGAGVGGGWLIQDGASGEADVRVGVGHLQLDF
jgi:hypothetical protein